MACLYVSTKLHDTLKKPRDILMTSYAVRFPDLAAKVKVVGGEVEMDHNVSPLVRGPPRHLIRHSPFEQVVENDRRRLIAIERLILEMICFNFGTRMSFSYVIKMGRALGCEYVSRALCDAEKPNSHSSQRLQRSNQDRMASRS